MINKNIQKIFSIFIICFFVASIFNLQNQTVKAQVVGSGSIDSGLVGYWRFDDGVGSVAVDSSGYSGTATLVNSPSWVSGKFSDAVMFNGVNNYVNCSLINSNFYPLTVSVWAKSLIVSAPGNPQPIFFKGNYANGFGIYFGNPASPNIMLLFAGVVWLDSGICPISNTWYNIAFTMAYYNVSQVVVSFFINGILCLSQNVDNPFVPTTNIFLGYDSTGSHFFNGSVDDYRYYDRILLNSEISILYNGYQINISHDSGSTVFPNITQNVGVDQDVSFSIGAIYGYVPWAIFLNGSAVNTQSIYTLFGVQNNYEIYVVSYPTQTNYISSLPIDYTTLILYLVLLVILIFLIVKPIPILGIPFSVITIILSASYFINNINLPSSIYLTIFLIVISICTILSNSLHVIKK